MDPFSSPEERAKWLALANTRADGQKRAQRERQRVQRLVAALGNRRVTASAEEVEAIDLYVGFFESFLRQVKLQDVDNPVWQVPDAATLAELDWEQTLSQALLLRLQCWELDGLARAIALDFDAALAGEPPQDGLPAAWLSFRALLPQRPDLVEALRHVRLELPELIRQVAQQGAMVDDLVGLPLADRARLAKNLSLPAVRGLHYRLQAHLRKSPEGDALLTGFKFPLNEEALKDEPPAPKGGTKKGLTNRILGMLKQ